LINIDNIVPQLLGQDMEETANKKTPESQILEFRRKELEDQDAQRDAMRKMTWFSLFGMLLYPLGITITSYIGLDDAAVIIGNIAPTYFVAISALVSVFFGANAYNSKQSSNQ